MKNVKYNPVIATVVVFACFCVLLWRLGAYNFVYLEHLNTFYLARHELVTAIELPGGLCMVIADFLTQFFVYPAVGVLVTAALLTAVTMVTARRLFMSSWCNAIMPLAALPAVSLAFLHYNVNYMYSGTVAMLLMLAVLSFIGSPLFKTISQRLMFSLVGTILLYATSGAVALLFGILVFIIVLFRKPKDSLMFLLCPAFAVLQGLISVYAGIICDLQHAILPAGYFTHRLEPTAFLWAPWVTMAAVFVIASLYKFVKNKSYRSKCVIFSLCASISAAYAVIGAKTLVNPQNEAFKELNCHIRDRQWDAVIDRCYQMPYMDNLLLQNCLNLALAERSELADRIFDHPCYDIRSIYITGDSKPYLYMLLSDVYYSMGHIALAQRHAFEALEGLGNRSPRMLQRLAETNIIYGNYKVAEKYIDRLSNTLMYRSWADSMRTLLADSAVYRHPYLSSKRACIFPDNRFSAYHGLDDDLKQVVGHYKGHPSTSQYLGTLCLLSKDMPRFMSALEAMDASETLPRPLPKAYAEAVVLAASGLDGAAADSLLNHYMIDPEMIRQFEDFNKNPSQYKQTLWYFLKYTR